MNPLRLRYVALSIVLATPSSGCVLLFAKTSSGKIPNTAAEEAYVISKAEPPSSCRLVGGFFGYDTPCGSGFGSVPDDVQFSCIRREITNAKGNYGVIDAVVGSGWYKGRTFACPSVAPPSRATASQVCIPGATQACVGAGGCKGGQACVRDGSGFSTCDCGNGTAPIERTSPF